MNYYYIILSMGYPNLLQLSFFASKRIVPGELFYVIIINNKLSFYRTLGFNMFLSPFFKTNKPHIVTRI